MSLRDKLLTIIDEEPGSTLSGEVLARRLGVSRTAIWKQMRALKIAGVPVESTGRQGYRVHVPFDSSLVRFRGPAGTTPHYFLKTVSTQALAKAGAAAGLPEGHLWIAETQTRGRGRLDRLWESSYGGLWCSLLLRPKLAPARLAPLTLVAGISLRQAVSEVCGLQLKLKWPNDLLGFERGGWKKFAGILTEMSGQMDRTDWAIIGLGLNVQNVLSPDLTSRAGSLYGVTGGGVERARILEAFLKNFMISYHRFIRDGFAPFRRLFWKHYFAPGKPVRLNTAAGEVAGTAQGVDDHGGLQVRWRGNVQAFSEGEIVL